MTSSDLERLAFTHEAVRTWSLLDRRFTNWPVVYVLDNDGPIPDPASRKVYVGESLNAAGRMRQHLESPDKRDLTTVRVVIDETFNKSACLDLESELIRLFAGDGYYQVLNRNDGITDADYFDRSHYQRLFRMIFDRLRSEGMFTRSMPDIQNDNLFKLSPFKALVPDQAIVVEDILEGLLEDLVGGRTSSIVIQGDPGTGKTVVAIYLMKLLRDLATVTSTEDLDGDSLFSEFYTDDVRELLSPLRVGIVVPQQSLRDSIKKVFKKTPGLSPSMVLTPFEVGESAENFDLLIVDEAHRLNQRANQPSGVQNKRFRDITVALFGEDDHGKTQLDWIVAKSAHRIFLVDAAQSVRPADLPAEILAELVERSREAHRHYRLTSQMRVAAGSDYVGYVRSVLSGPREDSPEPIGFDGYELRMFDDLVVMREAIRQRDEEFGLARLVAGYAWEWKSRSDPSAFDIEVDGVSLRWNGMQTDWIASPGAVNEVGSIHTVQGYDLNYAGVIIGPDLRFDPAARRLFFDRDSYFDAKGKENNKVLGKVYDDDDLLRFITNIYAVLLTRGIRGTFVYVCDPALREYLRRYFG